jgi:hypothetical protein
MEFLYEDYEYMLDLLKINNYTICDYTNQNNFEKCAILRHDVDFTLEKALDLARIEKKNEVTSTYFLLISTNFYNISSKESIEIINEIIGLGHDIGLHFDEKKYQINDVNSLEYYINKESLILKEIIGKEILSVSMHRPSKWVLENDINFKNIINTYSSYFFKDFKYISDSRMYWREDVLEIIKNQSFDKLHILTHPFWYSNKEESMKEKLMAFIHSSNAERYNYIKNNFRDVEEVLGLEEIV